MRSCLVEVDVIPEFRMRLELEQGGFGVLAKQWEGSDEAIEVHRGTHPVCIEAGGCRPAGRGCLSATGISEATFYVYEKRYGSLGLLDVRELRQLRDGNSRLSGWWLI